MLGFTFQIMLAVAFALCLSCAKSNFKGAANQDPNSEESTEVLGAESEDSKSVDSGNSESNGTETFTVELTKNQVDIVWVIDNSPSMREEAAQVHKNFDAFITETSSFAEVKIALISSSLLPVTIDSFSSAVQSKNIPVNLPATAAAKGHIQIDQTVSSTNLLALAAAASCPAASSMAKVTFTPTSEEHRICDLSFKADPTDPTQFFRRLENPEIIDQVKGSLTGFFRSDAKRVYIFVTDDEAMGLKSDIFLTTVQVGTPEIKPYVFAFRGVADQGTCLISNPGVAYDILAKNSGGEVFDICVPDWKPYFDQLTASINDIARSEYVLEKARVQKIVSITIDEKPLDPRLYTFKEGTVKIDHRALQVGQKIIINYAYIE